MLNPQKSTLGCFPTRAPATATMAPSWSWRRQWWWTAIGSGLEFWDLSEHGPDDPTGALTCGKMPWNNIPCNAATWLANQANPWIWSSTLIPATFGKLSIPWTWPWPIQLGGGQLLPIIIGHAGMVERGHPRQWVAIDVAILVCHFWFEMELMG